MENFFHLYEFFVCRLYLPPKRLLMWVGGYGQTNIARLVDWYVYTYFSNNNFNELDMPIAGCKLAVGMHLV